MGTNGRRPPGRRLSLFAIDVEAEENGVETQLAEPFEAFSFTLRGLHCEDVQDWIANETERRQRLNRNVDLSGRDQAAIFRSAIGQKIIVSWSGLLDDDGKVIPFSRDFAVEMMTERKWRNVADAVSSAVLDRARVRVEEDKAEGKESAISSATG